MSELRVLIPKGRLLNGVLALLERAHVEVLARGPRDLKPLVHGVGPGRIVKPRSIPQRINLGLHDVGFVGLDIVREQGYDDNVVPLLDLKLNRVVLVVAVAERQESILTHPPKRPLRIATEYTSIADRWATERNLAHVCIQTYGSTEGDAPGDADIVLDCVETGETMRANGLTIVDTIMESTTWMVVSKQALEHNRRAVESLRRKLEEVLR